MNNKKPSSILTRLLLPTLALCLGSGFAIQAASTNSWILSSGGNWNDPANWDPAGVPNDVGSVAILTNTIDASQSITNDVNVTLGGLLIGGPNSSYSFTIRPDSLGTTFWKVDNGGAGALFNDEGAGTSTTGDRIDVPIELADDLTVSTKTKGLTLAGVISESPGSPRTITKTGDGGYLTLNSTANTFSGGVIVKSGNLNAAGAGKAGTGTITLGDTVGTASASVIGNGTYTSTIVVAAGSTGKKTLRNSGSGGSAIFSGPLELQGDVEANASSSTRDTRISGPISGQGTITTTSQAGRQATNYVFLRGASSSTGGVILQTGNLRIYGHELFGYSGSTALNLTHSLGFGPLTINNNTILSSDGNSNRVLTNSVIVNGNFMIGLTNYGAGSLRFMGPIDLGSEIRTITLGSTVGHYIQGGITGAGGIIKKGPLGLSIFGTSTFSGGLTVAEGNVAFYGDSSFGTGVLTIGSATTDGNVLVTGAGTVPNDVLVVAGVSGTRAIGCTNFATAVFGGNVSLEADLTVGGAATYSREMVLSGSITGTGGLIVNGSELTTVTLAGANNYSGATMVNGGTLFLMNTTGSATGSGAVTVGAGAILAGKGSLGGTVTLNDGAVLAPGSADMGVLTFTGPLAFAAASTNIMEVDKTVGTNDVVVADSVTYAGTLVVKNLGGELAAGDSFKLFQAANSSGNFSQVIVEGSSASAQFDPATGILAIPGGIADYPTNISFSVSGSDLSLSWPETHKGWIVQSNSVNVADIASWFNIDGSEAGTAWNVKVDVSAPKVFYRLAKP